MTKIITKGATPITVAPQNRSSWMSAAKTTLFRPTLQDGQHDVKLVKFEEVLAKDTSTGKDFFRLTFSNVEGEIVDAVYEGRFPVFMDQVRRQLKIDTEITLMQIIGLLKDHGCTVWIKSAPYQGVMRQNVSYIPPIVLTSDDEDDEEAI